uniref:RING-type E3 ubiquitin transferase n=1 Tax=Heterorhabditis bacteriophora TaxID=37862 RepID=A0A1I7XD18_HETBA
MDSSWLEHRSSHPGSIDVATSTEQDVAHALDDMEDHLMCRVCRGDEGHLYYPCLCTGSIKYVHQECLTEWLKYSKKEVCELCNYKYSFQPIYRSDMPKALPIIEILKGVSLNAARVLRIWVVYTMVLMAWLGIVPLTAARIYHAVFYLNMHEILVLPVHLFKLDHVISDICRIQKKMISKEATTIVKTKKRGMKIEIQDLKNIYIYINSIHPDPPVVLDADPPPPEPPLEDNWRDWDRLGDELTWQRLLGLDGSFVFLEHVFWVISLNTLFTVLFAYSPYKLGYFLLNKMGIQQKIHYFPSIAAILTGYLTVSVCVYVLHAIVGLLKIKTLYRLLGISFLVLKVFLLVLIEIGFFPIICGCWMDLCSLKLFSASLSSRVASFSASPTSSVFIHWMVGMVYVFYSASFVLLLREVLRPGVLWFMRNLNDPEFNPIQEMIELPVTRHLRRLVASTSLFFSTILLIVYLPLGIVQKVSSVLPYNMSLSADTPLSELSLELLILQVVLPALLEQTQARSLLKGTVHWWCVNVGRALKLDRYLLPDQPGEIPIPNAPAAPPAGGLAAEHQALLLLREPQAYQPYVRPTLFPLRIVALLIAMGATWCLISCVLLLVPVLVGRAIIHNLSGYSNVHELYTVGTGLYVCWMSIKFGILAAEWFQRGFAQLSDAALKSFYLVSRYTSLFLSVLFVRLKIFRYLENSASTLAFCIIFLVITIFQTALFFPWQDWAMGVLHMKIICGGVMMGPEWWMRQVFDQVRLYLQIYQDGLRNLRARYILVELVLPVILFLGSLMAFPYLVARLYLFVTGKLYYCSNEVDFQRIMHENFRYLVGTQLVNYERESTDNEQAQPSSEQ